MATGKSGHVEFTASSFGGSQTMRINWSETYDQSAYTSAVTITSIQVKSNTYVGQSYFGNLLIKINGTTAVTLTETNNQVWLDNFDTFGTVTNASGTTVTGSVTGIAHNADGSKSVAIAIAANGYDNPLFWSSSPGSIIFSAGSKSITLTTIPRSFTLTRSQGANTSLTVQVTASNVRSVPVTISGNSGTVYSGETVKVTYSASTGYNASATYGSTAIASGGSFTVSGNVTVQSTATAKTYKLAIGSGTGYTITVKRGSTTLSNGATITHGESLTVSVFSSTGYSASSLKVNGTAHTSGNSYTVSGAMSVTATASVLSYSLSVSAGTGTTVTVNRTSSPKQGATTGTITNGATVYYSDVLNITISANSGYNLGTNTVKIGSTTSTGSGSYTVTGAVTVTATATAALTTISTGNGTFGAAQTITVTRHNSSYTHTIVASCAGQTQTIATKSSSTSISWTPAVSIMNSIKTAMSASCTLTCTTYNGNTSLGSSSVTITLSLPTSGTYSVKPTPSVSVTDGNGYASTYGGYVQGKSTFAVTVTDGLKYSATVNTRSTAANGSTYTGTSFTTAVVKTTGSNTITATVKDSRGQTGTGSTTATVLAYSAPTISSFGVHRCDSSGNADESGGYFYCSYTVAVTNLNSRNTRKLEMRYRKSSGGSWTTVTLLAQATVTSSSAVSGNSSAISVDQDASYNVELILTDQFGSVIRNTVLSTVPTVMDLYKDGTGVAFGKVAEVGNLMDVGWNMRLRGYNDHAASVIELTSGDTAATAWKKLTDIYDALPARSSKRVWVANNFGTLRGLSGGNLLIEMVSNGAEYGVMTAYQYWQGGQYVGNEPIKVAVLFGGTWGNFYGPLIPGSSGQILTGDDLVVSGSIRSNSFAAIDRNGTVIGSGSNLNSFVTPGTYFSSGSAMSASLSNTPITTSGFKLIVEIGYIAGTTPWIHQSAYVRNVVWKRYRTNDGTWSSWEPSPTLQEKTVTETTNSSGNVTTMGLAHASTAIVCCLCAGYLATPYQSGGSAWGIHISNFNGAAVANTEVTVTAIYMAR